MNQYTSWFSKLGLQFRNILQSINQSRNTKTVKTSSLKIIKASAWSGSSRPCPPQRDGLVVWESLFLFWNVKNFESLCQTVNWSFTLLWAYWQIEISLLFISHFNREKWQMKKASTSSVVYSVRETQSFRHFKNKILLSSIGYYW